MYLLICEIRTFELLRIIQIEFIVYAPPSKIMSKNKAFKININTCDYEDLRVLQGAGQVIADSTWGLGKQSPIDIETFAGIPKLTITSELIEFIDFSIFSV